MGSNDTTQDAEPRPKFLGMLGVSSSNPSRLIIIAASHDGFLRASFLNVSKALAGGFHAGPDIIYQAA